MIKAYARVLRYGKGWLDEKEFGSFAGQPEIAADRLDDADDPRGILLRRLIGQTVHPEADKFKWGGYSRIEEHPSKRLIISSKPRQSLSIIPVAERQELNYPDDAPHPPIRAFYISYDEWPNTVISNPWGGNGLNKVFTPEETLDIADRLPEQHEQQIKNLVYKYFPHLKPKEV